MTKFIQKKFQGTVPDNKILNTYSNSQIDTYSCDYINTLKSYSSEEHVVGVWFGKKIYSKTFITTETLNTNSPLIISHGITNYDKIWFDLSACFLFNTSAKQSQPLPSIQYFGNFSDRIAMQIDNNGTQIRLFSDTGWGIGWQKIITICYTKTTD